MVFFHFTAQKLLYGFDRTYSRHNLVPVRTDHQFIFQMITAQSLKQHAIVNFLATQPIAVAAMFCGTGKSRTMELHRLQHTSPHDLVVTLVPSLALMRQTVGQAPHPTPSAPLRVAAGDAPLELHVSSEAPCITDPEVIRSRLQHGARLIRCTYQSFPTLLSALETDARQIDVLYCDEAHHLTEPQLTLLFAPHLPFLSSDTLRRRKRSLDECHFPAFPTPRQLLLFTATPPVHWYDRDDTSHSGSGSIADSFETASEVGDSETFPSHDDTESECGSETSCSSDGVTSMESDEVMSQGVAQVAHGVAGRSPAGVEGVPPSAVLYRYCDALADGVLQDYEVRVDLSTEAERANGNNIYKAIARAVYTTGNRRVLTFHNEVHGDADIAVLQFCSPEGQRRMQTAFRDVYDEEFAHDPRVSGPVSVVLRGLSASTSVAEREHLFREFSGEVPTSRSGRADAEADCMVLSSCRTISEGVNLPAADMIVFVDASTQYVEIVQRVGRIVRKKPHDRRATVLLPITLSRSSLVASTEDGGRVGDALTEQLQQVTAFRPVQTVLAALRCEDDRLAMEVQEELVRKKSAAVAVQRTPGCVERDDANAVEPTERTRTSSSIVVCQSSPSWMVDWDLPGVDLSASDIGRAIRSVAIAGRVRWMSVEEKLQVIFKTFPVNPPRSSCKDVSREEINAYQQLSRIWKTCDEHLRVKIRERYPEFMNQQSPEEKVNAIFEKYPVNPPRGYNRNKDVSPEERNAYAQLLYIWKTCEHLRAVIRDRYPTFMNQQSPEEKVNAIFEKYPVNPPRRRGNDTSPEERNAYEQLARIWKTCEHLRETIRERYPTFMNQQSPEAKVDAIMERFPVNPPRRGGKDVPPEEINAYDQLRRMWKTCDEQLRAVIRERYKDFMNQQSPEEKLDAIFEKYPVNPPRFTGKDVSREERNAYGQLRHIWKTCEHLRAVIRDRYPEFMNQPEEKLDAIFEKYPNNPPRATGKNVPLGEQNAYRQLGRIWKTCDEHLRAVIREHYPTFMTQAKQPPAMSAWQDWRATHPGVLPQRQTPAPKKSKTNPASVEHEAAKQLERDWDSSIASRDTVRVVFPTYEASIDDAIAAKRGGSYRASHPADKRSINEFLARQIADPTFPEEGSIILLDAEDCLSTTTILTPIEDPDDDDEEQARVAALLSRIQLPQLDTEVAKEMKKTLAVVHKRAGLDVRDTVFPKTELSAFVASQGDNSIALLYADFCGEMTTCLKPLMAVDGFWDKFVDGAIFAVTWSRRANKEPVEYINDTTTQDMTNDALRAGRTIEWIKPGGWAYGGGTDTPMTTQVCRIV